DAAQLLPVGNAIDGGDALGISPAPRDRDITIGVIGRDHAVGDLEGAFLREQQKFVEEVVAFVLRSIELGAEIVMVEDELLAKELVRGGDQEDEVRRIAALHHIEAPGQSDLEQQARLMKESRGIFKKEAE